MLGLKPLAWWVLPWGLLVGGLLTLVFLGQMSWKPLSGCGQTSSSPYRPYSLRGGCATIDEGSPVRFLSSAPGVAANPGTSPRDADVSGASFLTKGGLAGDWLIWSLVSCVGLYILPPTKRTGRGHYVLPPTARTGRGDPVS